MRVMKKEVGLIIHRKQWEIGKASMCEVCNDLFNHKKVGEFHTIERWSNECTMGDYAKRLGCVEIPATHSLITSKSAEALLKSVTSKSMLSMDLTWKDYVIAFLVFVILSFVALLYVVNDEINEDSTWILLGVPFGGLMIALFYLAITQHRRKAKNYHLLSFLDRIHRLGVTPEQILSAAPLHLYSNERINNLLRLFQ